MLDALPRAVIYFTLSESTVGYSFAKIMGKSFQTGEDIDIPGRKFSPDPPGPSTKGLVLDALG